ncbi:hypothetical protein OAR33_00425 [bacterium]|nr:hypothetical protein [bacterium]
MNPRWPITPGVDAKNITSGSREINARSPYFASVKDIPPTPNGQNNVFPRPKSATVDQEPGVVPELGSYPWRTASLREADIADSTGAEQIDTTQPIPFNLSIASFGFNSRKRLGGRPDLSPPPA